MVCGMIVRSQPRILRRSRLALAIAAIVAAYVTVTEMPRVAIAFHAETSRFS